MTTPPLDDATLAALREAFAGTWSLEHELGRGGMATVFLARDVALDRPVALKILHPALAADPAARERFRHEARTGARLAHPHIVPVYAVEEAAGTVAIVMGLVEGESLRERILRDGPLPAGEAITVLRHVAWALGHAHAAGVLHRDVTLDNVLLERRSGRALLVDFGIAAEVDRADAGPLLGTPAYLAPELIQGDPPTAASDLYALGIAAWAMLAGRLPFDGEVAGDVLLRHLTEPVPDLRRAAPATPSRLVRAVEACLAKDPAARPASAEAWLRRLDGDASGRALAAPLARWVDHWQQVRAFYALAFSLAAMIGALMLRGDVEHFLGYGPVGTALTLLVVAAPLLTIAGGIHVAIGLRTLRALARDGYRTDDLRLALPPVPSAATDREPLVHRAARVATTSATAVLGTLSVAYGTLAHGSGYDWEFARFLGGYAMWAMVTLWTSLGLLVLLPPRHGVIARGFATLRRRFWTSRAGAFLFRVATIGLRRVDAPEATLHRPTALVLDLAIEALWLELPEDARRRFAELPALARTLRERVLALKALRERIDRHGTGDDATLAAARERLADRELAGTTLLERLRIGLGDLLDSGAAEGAFTADLGDARTMASTLLVELGAHAGLVRLAERRVGGVSPTPTPA